MDSTTQVVADFNLRYPDVGTTAAERLLNMVHKRIISRLAIRETTRDISLTDGTREYDLNEADTHIRAAYYIRSATAGDYKELIPRSVDWMDEFNDGWRASTDESEPNEYYVASLIDSDTSKKRIGFHQIPPTTTSGGYPVVRLYVVQNATLSGADTIPADLLDSQIYLDGMSWLYAKEQGLPSEQKWFQDFEFQIHQNRAHIDRMNRHDPNIFYPSWASGQGVV